MNVIVSVVFFGVSLIQIAAIIGGLHDWLDWNIVISSILAVFITWIPIVGAVLGILGAIHAWHWELWQAVLLFAWPWVLILFFGTGSAIFNKLSNR